MGFIGGIVNISIGAIMLSAVFISTVKNAHTLGECVNNYTGVDVACTYGTAVTDNISYTGAWTTSEVVLWSVLTIAGIVGLVVGTLNVFGIA